MPFEGDQLAAWLRSRAGKLTASRMGTAMAFKKNGEPTAERSRLLRELLAERLTGDSVRHFVTDAMVWGLEKEAEARAAYEDETGMLVHDAGFYDHSRIDMLGATPDGLIGHDGLLETKAPTSETYIAWRLAGTLPPEHLPQMAIQLACTGRSWVDFCAYDPRQKNPRHRLFIRRYEPSRDEIAKYEGHAEKFLADLEAMFEAFTTADIHG